MGFWAVMLAVVLLLPAFMLGMGIWYTKKPPRYFSRLVGYRTAMAKKSRDTWRFAQRFFGKICCFVSPAVLALSLVGMLLFLGKSIFAVAIFSCILLAVQGTIYVSLMIPTELALRKVYNRYGRIR